MSGEFVKQQTAAGSTMPLAAWVHGQLRADILLARLRPGELLSENQLAQRLGVSRTPVREAIQRLVREAWVQVLPQRGSLVALMNVQRIREALFVREAVECLAVQHLLASPETATDWGGLETCLADHERALAAQSHDATMQADENFHRELLNLSGHSGVWQVVAQARDMHQRVRAIALPELGSGRKALQDHREILDALRAGDVKRAVQQVGSHVQHNAVLTERIAQLHPDYFDAKIDGPG